ncbi:MAG: CDGSH iron-sulfur domain-containing protein [Actinomycetota bacterium]
MTREPRIRVVPNGPMLVEGLPLTRLLREADGSQSTRAVDPAPGDPYALCRCGRSTSLPLCDGEPPYACFEEEPQGGGPPPKPFRWEVPDPTRPGIALKQDGPVRVAGGVPIETEDGQRPPVDRVSLCRCGVSASQPVCDGSHKIVGYRDQGDPSSAT